MSWSTTRYYSQPGRTQRLLNHLRGRRPSERPPCLDWLLKHRWASFTSLQTFVQTLPLRYESPSSSSVSPNLCCRDFLPNMRKLRKHHFKSSSLVTSPFKNPIQNFQALFFTFFFFVRHDYTEFLVKSFEAVVESTAFTCWTVQKNRFEVFFPCLVPTVAWDVTGQ